MEALKGSLSEMMTLFQERMSNFEAQLQRNPGTSGGTDSLAADYNAFKKFVLDALSCLQQQMKALARELDNVEMRGRRKMVLLHGVAEQAKEDTAQVVAEVVRSHLELADFSVSEVRRCHRMGRPTGASKPRPILCKLRDVSVRDSIWFAKMKLKGTGITISEFLTRSRHQLFMSARDKFGVNNCWTKQGHIYVVGSDGSRHRVGTLDDIVRLEQIKEKSCPVATIPSSSSSLLTPVPKKGKRVVAKKK
ncbi:uncharacterized protein LOC124631897 [Helicoverpa zea]|uniref:uncharacterized protein LOC124631897 n=1 Tax=Helicoverpa zea TaxID=7113 RepID=UPI001F5A22CD|nr:uncharacterized protein LOC124631897 [Helicoverpa zea]